MLKPIELDRVSAISILLAKDVTSRLDIIIISLL